MFLAEAVRQSSEWVSRLGAGSREPGAGSRGPGTGDQRPRARGQPRALQDQILNSELVYTESQALLFLSLHFSNPHIFYSSSRHSRLTDLCRSHRHHHTVQKGSNTLTIPYLHPDGFTGFLDAFLS